MEFLVFAIFFLVYGIYNIVRNFKFLNNEELLIVDLKNNRK
jgi:hypothetical protein